MKHSVCQEKPPLKPSLAGMVIAITAIMEEEQRKFERTPTARNLGFDDPLVLGAMALALGFTIGSGRIKWLGEKSGKIAEGLSVLAMRFMSSAVQERHPELFLGRSRITH